MFNLFLTSYSSVTNVAHFDWLKFRPFRVWFFQTEPYPCLLLVVFPTPSITSSPPILEEIWNKSVHEILLNLWVMGQATYGKLLPYRLLYSLQTILIKKNLNKVKTVLCLVFEIQLNFKIVLL